MELARAGNSLKFLKIAEGPADLYPRLALIRAWNTAASHEVLEVASLSLMAMLFDLENVKF